MSYTLKIESARLTTRKRKCIICGNKTMYLAVVEYYPTELDLNDEPTVYVQRVPIHRVHLTKDTE